MKVLFIGGTGIISSACSTLALQNGIDLYHLNRGESKSIRNIPGVKHLQGNIHDTKQCEAILKDHHFDAVVDFIVFEPDHLKNDISLFRNKTDQYIFISSASAYQTPPESLPITESTPLSNPYWQYSRNKMACEQILQDEFAKNQFPYTIVRPSHTYDKTLVPFEGGTTVLHRLLNNEPVVVHGEGTSVWTLTHHRDFAVGLVGLLNNPKAIGEAFHITSDEYLSWNQIFKIVAQKFNVEAKIVHVPSKNIAAFDSEMGASLLGDKSHSMIFDNSKIKSVVPEFNAKIKFEQGAEEIAQWFQEDLSRVKLDPKINSVFDQLVKQFS